MALPLLPPKTEELIDESKFPTLNWLAFFDDLAVGDSGTTWTPTFVDLIESGTATKTGKYWRLSKNIAYFRIVITPGTNTSATAGTTYCDNFPLNISQQAMAMTMSGATASVSGITPSPKRIYTAAWTTITTPITITGIIEVS
jgi:hypothetical protein